MHLCAITHIDCEHEGEQIDCALLKNVLEIFVEIGMDAYENNFEKIPHSKILLLITFTKQHLGLRKIPTHITCLRPAFKSSLCEKLLNF
jgi:hypothetical protein